VGNHQNITHLKCLTKEAGERTWSGRRVYAPSRSKANNQHNNDEKSRNSRVLQGGSFNDNQYFVLCASRRSYVSGLHYGYFGFRLPHPISEIYVLAEKPPRPCPYGMLREDLGGLIIYYSSSVLTSPSGNPCARAFNTRRMILPERVFGNLSTNFTSSGRAIGPM